MWVKSHKGIDLGIVIGFNKLQQADKAARAGTNSDTIGPNIPIWDCNLEQVGIDKKNIRPLEKKMFLGYLHVVTSESKTKMASREFKWVVGKATSLLIYWAKLCESASFGAV